MIHKVMDLEWPHDIQISERTITVITGPPRIVTDGLDSSRDVIRRYPFLYVCSNYSEVLPFLHRTTYQFSVRRGFTSDQIATIIAECDATYLFIEHDPSLYESDVQLIPSVINRIATYARREGTVIVYSGRTDRFIRDLIRVSDRAYLHADWKNMIRIRRLQEQRRAEGRTYRSTGRQLKLNDPCLTGGYGPEDGHDVAADTGILRGDGPSYRRRAGACRSPYDPTR
jgi:hypothetical protein